MVKLAGIILSYHVYRITYLEAFIKQHPKEPTTFVLEEIIFIKETITLLHHYNLKLILNTLYFLHMTLDLWLIIFHQK